MIQVIDYHPDYGFRVVFETSEMKMAKKYVENVIDKRDFLIVDMGQNKLLQFDSYNDRYDQFYGRHITD